MEASIQTLRRIPLIFLADDDIDDIYLFERALRDTSLQYMIQAFGHGRNLLQGLQDIHPVYPDIVFIDINMPESNGFESLRKIRAIYSEELPVFLLSTANNGEYIAAGRDLGATGFLTKPCALDRYTDLLTDIVTRDWAGYTKFDFYVRIE